MTTPTLLSLLPGAQIPGRRRPLSSFPAKDCEIGSIEAGKLADFAVLQEDPLAVAQAALKDVPAWGTVLGGQPFPAEC